MLGINSLSLNTSSIVDCYNVVNDKKNDTIATVIANRRSNKDRASATMIGAKETDGSIINAETGAVINLENVILNSKGVRIVNAGEMNFLGDSTLKTSVSGNGSMTISNNLTNIETIT